MAAAAELLLIFALYSVIPANSPYFRHPGERRDPGFQPVHMRKVWVPTYVGMTEMGERFPG